MKAFYRGILFLLITIATMSITLLPTAAITIECDHETNDWLYYSPIYICNVITNVTIIHANTRVTQVIGHHEVNKTNAEVSGILMAHKTVNFFPQGFDSFFTNVTVIQIQSCGLSEVRKEDLQPFGELRALYLPGNVIHLVEKDTFIHNPILEVIWLNQNNIKYIDPCVFDHLDRLASLNLLGSVHDLGRASSQLEVHKAVANVKEIFGFASVLWADNQELTTEVSRYRTFLEISLVLNLLVLFTLIAYVSVRVAKKFRRSNRVHDESKISTLTELYEFQNRFRNANFSE